jgi:hypothetical protein
MLISRCTPGIFARYLLLSHVKIRPEVILHGKIGRKQSRTEVRASIPERIYHGAKHPRTHTARSQKQSKKKNEERGKLANPNLPLLSALYSQRNPDSMEPKQLSEPNRPEAISHGSKEGSQTQIFHYSLFICCSRRYGGWIYFLEKAPATKTKLAKAPGRCPVGIWG